MTESEESGVITYEVNDFVGLLEVVKELHKEYPGTLWWRGQARDLTLVPKVFRDDDANLIYERNVINQFRRLAPTRYDECPDRGDRTGWLFLMQHFGAPTRLLDWTESPLVGLYFSLSDKDHYQKDGVLWMLYPFGFNGAFHGSHGVYMSSFDPIQPLFQKAFSDDPADLDEAAAVVAEEMDARMMLQLSGFTVHGSPKPLERLELAIPHLTKIVIKSEAKIDLFTLLRRLGIKRRNLFPNLENLAEELAGLTFRGEEGQEERLPAEEDDEEVKLPEGG